MSDQAAKYWQTHAESGCSINEMMLDENAVIMEQRELQETLSIGPNMKNKDVLELGAGIGRYSGVIAETAKSVTAVDFVQKFCDKNAEVNGKQHKNLTVECNSVMDCQYSPGSFDVIFSNWLMMYLSDEEVEVFIQRCLTWLRPGGFFYFRESCFHQSGSRPAESFNPTIYRNPAEYTSRASCAKYLDPTSGKTLGFDIVLLRNMQTYIDLKGNKNQYCWLLQKNQRADHSGQQTFQEFLDNQQYSKNGILRYEKVFGLDYLSSGGLESTVKFCKELHAKQALNPGTKVLDIGSGIGGSAFLMKKEYGCEVLGIDLSINMVEISIQKNEAYKYENVRFEVSDCTLRDFPESSYDLIYSRDTILHIQDKPALFRNFYRWLKPGGKLFISDYCAGEKSTWNSEFSAYVASRGYDLHTPAGYGKMIEEAGFSNVEARDATPYWREILTHELEKIHGEQRGEILKEFTEKDLQALEDGWKAKVVRVDQGFQKWGTFYAEKL